MRADILPLRGTYQLPPAPSKAGINARLQTSMLVTEQVHLRIENKYFEESHKQERNVRSLWH